MPCPVIRVAGLVALAVGLSTAAPAALAAASVLVAVLAWAAGAGVALPLAALKRLRWLLLSVTLLYGWFLPGSPLVPALGDASPTLAGLAEGLRRAWMLWLMASAARMLIRTTPRESLVAAINWWLAPLAWAGLDTSRFGLRLVLTLEYALALAPRYRREGGTEVRGGLVAKAAALARRGVNDAEARAVAAAETRVQVPRSAMPPVHQWAYPLALAAVLLLLSGVSLP